MSREHTYYTCSCSTPEHTLRLAYWDDNTPGFDSVDLEQYIDYEYGLFKRVWIAVKYVFKRSSIFPFCDTMMSPEEFTKFHKAVNAIKSRMDEKRKL
jgi:hypothetical protein